MIMTTMGSEFWPKTAEGRVLCVLLALYAFGVFGYVTAALASFFVGHDTDEQKGPAANAAQVERLAEEIAALREQLSRLAQRPPAR